MSLAGMSLGFSSVLISASSGWIIVDLFIALVGYYPK